MRLKVENLEGKMEIQKLKHQENLRALREENAKLREELTKSNDPEIAKHSRDQLSTPKNKTKDVEEEKSFNRKKRKVADDRNEITKRQKQVEELSETEQKILEGIEKYAICKRRAVTNYFRTYDQWFDWLENINQNTTTCFENVIFINQESSIITSTIIFTEDKDFPITSRETVFPLIKQGWSVNNTNCYLLQSRSPKEIKVSSTEELDKRGYERYFTFKPPRERHIYSNRRQFESYNPEWTKYRMLVLVKDE